MMNGPNPKPTIAHETPQRPGAFTITALNRLSHGGIDRCAPVAYLRMSGRWLQQYGFQTGCRVLVTAEEGRLVLTLDDHSTADLNVDVAPSHSRVHGANPCDQPSN